MQVAHPALRRAPAPRLPVPVSLRCNLACPSGLPPRLTIMRHEDSPQRFERLHRLSAMLDSTVLAMLILASAALATR